jgi:hypothetical protein
MTFPTDAFFNIPYHGQIYSVIVDRGDFEKYKYLKWHWANCSRHKNTPPKLYARYQTKRGGKNVTYYLHRLVANALPGVVVDHEDGNGLNCRRRNLICTSVAENARRQLSAVERRVAHENAARTALDCGY